jgi:hypothetical protein
MNRKLALVLVGDVMLGRIVDESLTALPRQLHGGVWGDVLPLLQGGMAAGAGEEQLVAGNLECAVTAEEQKVGGRESWLAGGICWSPLIAPTLGRRELQAAGTGAHWAGCSAGSAAAQQRLSRLTRAAL